MIPLNGNEIRLLRYLFNYGNGQFYASQIEHQTKMSLFKIRRTLDCLESKRLVRSYGRSRTKPYILSKRGMAFGWLVSKKTSGIVELYKRLK